MARRLCGVTTPGSYWTSNDLYVGIMSLTPRHRALLDRASKRVHAPVQDGVDLIAQLDDHGLVSGKQVFWLVIHSGRPNGWRDR